MTWKRGVLGGPPPGSLTPKISHRWFVDKAEGPRCFPMSKGNKHNSSLLTMSDFCPTRHYFTRQNFVKIFTKYFTISYCIFQHLLGRQLGNQKYSHNPKDKADSCLFFL